MKKNIDELVRKIIKESLEGKAGELENKIGMDEWDQEPTISAQPTDMVEEEDDVDSDIESRLCDEDSDEYDEERCSYNRKAKMGGSDELDEISAKDLVKGKKYKMKTPSFEDEIEYDSEMEYPEGKPMYGFKGKKAHHAMGDTHIEDFLSDIDEELIGGQKKLDKNKNNKLDSEDFKMLRGDVEEGFGDFFDDDYEDIHGYLGGDEEERFHPLKNIKGEKDTAMSRMRRGKGDVEDIDFEEMDEEMEEGNAFTGALAKTKKGDKFNLGGKSYTDRSDLEEAEKFIQKVYEGIIHKKKSVKESLQLTESEMIDLIEKIVMEQKKAKGMAETEKVQNASKKENEAAMKEVSKKMKEYVKSGSEGEYETNPEQFPQSNGQMKRQNAMKYVPSDAVEEYIDAFAYPGQTNLTFDEIKPDDKNIDKYLNGDSTTGNAVKDKKGKALGNVVPSKVGEKFKKNFDENLYGAEQKNASYKRQSQPVDVSGSSLQKGHLKNKKSSAAKAQKVLDKVDESINKKDVLISEEFDKMKHLIGYNKKTQ